MKKWKTHTLYAFIAITYMPSLSLSFSLSKSIKISLHTATKTLIFIVVKYVLVEIIKITGNKYRLSFGVLLMIFMKIVLQCVLWCMHTN